MSKRRICGCCMIFNDYQHVLIGYKLKQMGWEFPGGKSEGDEPILTTAVREVYEETGLLIPGMTYVGYFDRDPRWALHIFGAYHCSNDFEPRTMEPDKQVDWRWVEHIEQENLTKMARAVIAYGFLDAAKDAVFRGDAYEGLLAR